MKKILLSTTLLFSVVAATNAFAADLPTKRYVAPPVFEQAFNWTGFYVGVNAGYGFGGDRKSTYEDARWIYGNSADDGGFVGGGQIGYNYQVADWVYGIEADFQYADLGGSTSWNRSWGAASAGMPSEMGGDLTWFGTLRARVGYAGIDRTLIYATGGLAYAGGDDDGMCKFLINNYSDTYGKCQKDDAWGWTLGMGVEYAFTNNLTAKIEGLYVDIDRKNSRVGVTSVNYDIYRTSGDDSFGVVRVGLNYKF